MKILNNIKLYFNRTHLNKLEFIAICNEIISKKLSFDESLVKLNKFIEVVRIYDKKTIVIDNNYGRFYALWDKDGVSLLHHEFQTRRQ